MHLPHFVDECDGLGRLTEIVQCFRLHQQHVGIAHQRDVDGRIVLLQPLYRGRHKLAEGRPVVGPTVVAEPVVILLAIHTARGIVPIVALIEDCVIEPVVIKTVESRLTFLHILIHQRFRGQNLVPSLQLTAPYPAVHLGAVVGPVGIIEGELYLEYRFAGVLVLSVEHACEVAHQFIARHLVKGLHRLGEIFGLLFLGRTGEPCPAQIGISGATGGPSHIIGSIGLGKCRSRLEFADDKVPTVGTRGECLVEGCTVARSDVFVANDDLFPVEQQPHVVVPTQEVGLGLQPGALVIGEFVGRNLGHLLQYLTGEVGPTIEMSPIVGELGIAVGIGEIVEFHPVLVVHGIVARFHEVFPVGFHGPQHFTHGPFVLAAVHEIELRVGRRDCRLHIGFVSPERFGGEIVG